jgi:hypothetical protein
MLDKGKTELQLHSIQFEIPEDYNQNLQSVT